jgi:hypothetical protein
VSCKSFHLYNVEFDLWSVESDHGEVPCCGLSKVSNAGDGWNPSGDVVCHARIC